MLRAALRWLCLLGLTAAAFQALAACTLVVDTEELQQGDSGLSCNSDQKVCPDPAHPGRGMCVSKTNPSFGCSADSCAACALPNAAARCSNDGECAIATCQGTHFDCN